MVPLLFLCCQKARTLKLFAIFIEYEEDVRIKTSPVSFHLLPPNMIYLSFDADGEYAVKTSGNRQVRKGRLPVKSVATNLRLLFH